MHALAMEGDQWTPCDIRTRHEKLARTRKTGFCHDLGGKGGTTRRRRKERRCSRESICSRGCHEQCRRGPQHSCSKCYGVPSASMGLIESLTYLSNPNRLEIFLTKRGSVLYFPKAKTRTFLLLASSLLFHSPPISDGHLCKLGS